MAGNPETSGAGAGTSGGDESLSDLAQTGAAEKGGPVNQAQISKNIDAIVKQGMKYDGPLGDYFAQRAAVYREKLQRQSDAKTKAGIAGFTPEYIEGQVAQHMGQEASKAKSALQHAAKGESKAAAASLEDVTGLAGSIGGITEAISSLNPLKILGALGSLLSNSVVGKYVRAGLQWLMGTITGKGESFSDIITRINFDAGMAPVAKTLGVDKGDLTSAMLAKSAPVVPEAPTGRPPAEATAPTNEKAAPPVATPSTPQTTTPATPPVTTPATPPITPQAGTAAKPQVNTVKVVLDTGFTAQNGTLPNAPTRSGSPLPQNDSPVGMARPNSQNTL